MSWTPTSSPCCAGSPHKTAKLHHHPLHNFNPHTADSMARGFHFLFCPRRHHSRHSLLPLTRRRSLRWALLTSGCTAWSDGLRVHKTPTNTGGITVVYSGKIRVDFVAPLRHVLCGHRGINASISCWYLRGSGCGAHCDRPAHGLTQAHLSRCSPLRLRAIFPAARRMCGGPCATTDTQSPFILLASTGPADTTWSSPRTGLPHHSNLGEPWLHLGSPAPSSGSLLHTSILKHPCSLSSDGAGLSSTT